MVDGLLSGPNAPCRAVIRLHEVNDRHLFFSLRAEIPSILEAGGEAVVNVSSLNGLRGFAKMTACGSSKFGAVSTTLTVASEFAKECE
jgi:NAD(P)-dependent dehydrogenase (short-subunit alcohol dehydrogenase family)